MLRKIAGALVFVAAFIAFRGYNFNKAKAEVRQNLETTCADDTKCKDAVSAHFETCWKKNADAGGRHRRMKVDGAGMVQCINSESGVEYFEYDEK